MGFSGGQGERRNRIKALSESVLEGDFGGTRSELWYILALLEAIVSLEAYNLPPVTGGHLDQPAMMWRDMEAVRQVLVAGKRTASDAAQQAHSVIHGSGIHADVPPPPLPKDKQYGNN